MITPRTGVDAPGFHDDQLPRLQPLLADFLRERGARDIVAWFATPMALPLIAELGVGTIVFDAAVGDADAGDLARQWHQRESALLRSAQLLLADGPSRLKQLQSLHSNILCLPNGVDAQALPRRANIHWLGPQPQALLPQIVADWDACLLPWDTGADGGLAGAGHANRGLAICRNFREAAV